MTDEKRYGVTTIEKVETTQFGESPWGTSELRREELDEALRTDEMRVKVWRFSPGEKMSYHTHSEQEELFYVLQGTFKLKIGVPGDIETRVVDAGTFFAAPPEVGRGYRNIGDEEGLVLVVAAPDVDDEGERPSMYYGFSLFDDTAKPPWKSSERDEE